MTIRDEELIEYLLGEAEPALIRRIEACLKIDQTVAQRLQELRAALGLLDSIKASVEPPDDLVARTMASIDASSHSDAASESFDVEPSEIVEERAGVRRTALASAQPTPRVTRCIWDSAILSLSVVALTCLLLPLVLEARSQSRRMQCAEHLRTLGQGLTQWAMLNPEHRFPAVPVSGPESFAGVFAVKLNDIGELPSSGYLRCVSIPATEFTAAQISCVPTSDQLRLGTTDQLGMWRKMLGGDYAYNFGVIDDGKIVGPVLQGRTHFAILSDAPQIDGDCDVFFAHEGQGINLYYEDGHVAFSRLPRCSLSDRPTTANVSRPAAGSAVVPVNGWRAALDHPFRNLEGRQAHGLSLNDAALGPSKSAPLPSRVSMP